MARVSRYFPAGSCSALLARAALAVALLVQASPSHAVTVTLSCRNATGSDFQTLRINYATGLVEQLSPSGKPYTNRIAPNARISGNAIVWSVRLMDTGLANPVPMIWAGTIDRLSGNGWTEFSREPDWQVHRIGVTCSEATKPKF